MIEKPDGTTEEKAKLIPITKENQNEFFTWVFYHFFNLAKGKGLNYYDAQDLSMVLVEKLNNLLTTGRLLVSIKKVNENDIKFVDSTYSRPLTHFLSSMFKNALIDMYRREKKHLLNESLSDYLQSPSFTLPEKLIIYDNYEVDKNQLKETDIWYGLTEFIETLPKLRKKLFLEYLELLLEALNDDSKYIIDRHEIPKLLAEKLKKDPKSISVQLSQLRSELKAWLLKNPKYHFYLQ